MKRIFHCSVLFFIAVTSELLTFFLSDIKINSFSLAGSNSFLTCYRSILVYVLLQESALWGSIIGCVKTIIPPKFGLSTRQPQAIFSHKPRT